MRQGGGILYFEASVVQWNTGNIYAPGGLSLCLKGSILFLKIVYFLFLGKQRSCDGGRAAPVLRVYVPKKTGARSARTRRRGQNPLVELYKQWYTLADFLPNWNISRAFLYISLIRRKD